MGELVRADACCFWPRRYETQVMRYKRTLDECADAFRSAASGAMGFKAALEALVDLQETHLRRRRIRRARRLWRRRPAKG